VIVIFAVVTTFCAYEIPLDNRTFFEILHESFPSSVSISNPLESDVRVESICRVRKLFPVGDFLARVVRGLPVGVEVARLGSRWGVDRIYIFYTGGPVIQFEVARNESTGAYPANEGNVFVRVESG